MPKLRTNKATRKRFRVTKTGKVLHLRAGNAKLKAKKPTSKKRRYDQAKEVTSKKQIKSIKRAINQ